MSMPPPKPHSEPLPTRESGLLRRLVALRWAILLASALAVALVPPLLGIPLPMLPLWLALSLLAGANVLAWQRLRQHRAAGAGEVFLHLLIDLGGLTALVFFSGGVTNPLISLLLLPVAVAALSLPLPYVLVVSGLAISAYSMLTLVFVPLPLDDAARAASLHLGGMWLTFLVSVVMIVWLVMRLSALLRERDASLAAAREAALRDERVLALGALAAGAAHELGTPLATLAVLAGELEHEPGIGEAGRADLALMRQQIGICKGIISGLASRAGADRAELVQPADAWIEALLARWHAARPHAESRLEITGKDEAPAIVAEATLEQALQNLFNNAANAAAAPVRVLVDWDEENLDVRIIDQGPGYPSGVLEVAGSEPLPARGQGTGIGLFLSRTAVERMGGRLFLCNPQSGGAEARLVIPLASLRHSHRSAQRLAGSNGGRT